MHLISGKEGQYSSQADPFLIRAEDGKFYLYVTGEDGVHAFCADSLTGEYRDIGIVFAVPDGKAYWAPSVLHTHGQYWMYVSFMKKDETDVHLQTVHAACSDSPAGRWRTADSRRTATGITFECICHFGKKISRDTSCIPGSL